MQYPEHTYSAAIYLHYLKTLVVGEEHIQCRFLAVCVKIGINSFLQIEEMKKFLA